jgi:hypothetical protein
MLLVKSRLLESGPSMNHVQCYGRIPNLPGFGRLLELQTYRILKAAMMKYSAV